MIMPSIYRGGATPSVQAPRFRPGQLVRHKRYNYRGVVADHDPSCQAEDAWYYKNQTQPDRGQPWYHVLVDGTSSATYAAEENLVADDSIEPVQHPMLAMFFEGYCAGRYVRNDTPWMGW